MKLYTELARVYHEMYQTLFDYEKEFAFLEDLLREFGCGEVLEVGCGTGNLASRFLKAGFVYTGMDLFEEMLAIAREVEPKGEFLRGDMRDFDLGRRFEAVVISGRSFTHMTTDADATNALKSVRRHLRENGVLIFDNFDARGIFPGFKNEMTQTARFGDREYTRISRNTVNRETGWTWNWNATYEIREKDETQIVKDSTVLRAFTESEIAGFLDRTGFALLRSLREGVAFTTIARLS
ncbi:MAG: class I SAM-dependent DNA methyltransferase [Planctomycetota bacterium]|jgi:SAM-dependent methyltransferase